MIGLPSPQSVLVAAKGLSRRAAAATPSVLPQLAAVALLVVVATAILVVLNVALNAQLWGELLFAWGVATLAIYALGQFGKKVLAALFGVPPPTWWQAAVWALITVIALPVAVADGWRGVAIFLGSATGLWTITRLSRRRSLPLWAAGLISFAPLFLALWLSPKKAGGDVVLADATPPVAEGAKLARRFRPLLFFDSGERFIPMDIDRGIAEGRVEICRRGILRDVAGEECPDARDEDFVDESFAYMKLRDDPLERGERQDASRSGYYHHVLETDEPARIYLDYWWYFAENPSAFKARVLCGPALQWAWRACAEHPADWEGITVVLARCSANDARCVETAAGRVRVERVHYAQHNEVFSYDWAGLKRSWSKPSYEAYTGAAGGRPLVFVALNSHASYPYWCLRKCRQTSRWYLSERRNGRLPWVNNPQCGSCLQPIPTTATGSPNRWNAFKGQWGPQDCILRGAFCKTWQAPVGPASQRRYRDPSRAEARD